jgi:hypothetical protein
MLEDMRINCPNCGTANRIRVSNQNRGIPVCGRCKADLRPTLDAVGQYDEREKLRLKTEILALVQNKRRAIMPDLHGIPGFIGGGVEWQWEGKNIVLWDDLTPEAVLALNELLGEGKLLMRNTYASLYKKAGPHNCPVALKYPMALSMAYQNYVRWLPVELRVPKRGWFS